MSNCELTDTPNQKLNLFGFLDDTLRVCQVYLLASDKNNFQITNKMNTVEAIYEKGVFRPIQKVDFEEGERVEIITLCAT